MWVDRATLDAWKKERDDLRGAMAAQDERERVAGDACGVPWTMHGCDWPDAVAEEVKVLRRERDASRSILRAQDEDICAILRDRDALREQLATAMMERDALRADLIKAVQHGMAAIMHAERVRAEAVPLDPADRHPCGAWYCKGGCDGCAECQMDHGSAR